MTVENLQQLTEHIRDWRPSDIHIDAEQRIVRNIALAGLESANGYRYSEEALSEALPLYANKPVFLDHARNTSRPFERSTRDLVGSVVNPRFEAGRLRGDIQTLETEAGRTFIALAESNSPAVGMSHVVLARRNGDGTLVEKIEQVVSVDAVAFPATSATFSEQRDEPFDALLSVDSESRLNVEELESQLEVVTGERDELRRKLHTHETRVTKSAKNKRVEQLLSESQLPAYAVTPQWREQLLDADDDAARRALIAERRALLQQLRVHDPASCERVDGDAETTRDDAFVEAIRACR